jgi:apolipoprotein N-acyltransferase
VNVCYEDAFGEERIAAAREATLLVNISNDAWFGASLAPWQHLQIGAMRSLEAGRWQLRANNTGITAILDDKGRVRARLEPFATGALTGQARGRTGSTPYLSLGNTPAILIPEPIQACTPGRKCLPWDAKRHVTRRGATACLGSTI